MLENLELTTVDQSGVLRVRVLKHYAVAEWQRGSGISSIGSSGRHKLVQKAAQAERGFCRFVSGCLEQLYI